MCVTYTVTWYLAVTLDRCTCTMPTSLHCVFVSLTSVNNLQSPDGTTSTKLFQVIYVPALAIHRPGSLQCSHSQPNNKTAVTAADRRNTLEYHSSEMQFSFGQWKCRAQYWWLGWPVKPMPAFTFYHKLRLFVQQPLTPTHWFLPCDAMRCTVSVLVILSVCPSVCLSVCLSHSWTVSTWFYLRSRFLHHMVAPSF